MSLEKTRISIVNYTNTLPFKWALKRSSFLQKIDLQEDIPSICAQKLKFGQVDLALVPIALLPELDEYHIVSKYCIGAIGKVETVKLYSQVPIQEIQNVGLDYQSKTSNALTRVLFHYFWKKSVKFNDSLPGFESSVEGSHAIVVIGDRTFSLNGKFPFEYDLAEEWQKATGLPFVFAAWVSTKPLDKSFESEFESCLKQGIEQLSLALEENSGESPINREKTHEYLTQRISYSLDADKLKAMDLFLELKKTLPFSY